MKSLFLALCLISTSVFAQQNFTLTEWKKFTDEKKAEELDRMVSWTSIKMTPKGYVFSKDDKTPSPMKKLIADYYVKFVKTESELSDEVYDDIYGQIGSPTFELDFYFSKDKKILGSQLRITQRGCSHLDAEGELTEQTTHYETEKEANKNGCFDNDVSWTGWSIRDENAKEIYTNGYMEWTGH